MSEMTELMGLPSSPMEYIMNRLPGGTLITDDEIVTDINTIFQETHKAQRRNRHKEWEEMIDEGEKIEEERKDRHDPQI